MQHLDQTVERDIFKLRKGLYLVCNDKVGYFTYQKIDLPIKFSLQDHMNIDVYNQLSTNSCSANAICQQIKLNINFFFFFFK
jgi:hypothetical protein